jgi:hypothetical protein
MEAVKELEALLEKAKAAALAAEHYFVPPVEVKVEQSTPTSVTPAPVAPVTPAPAATKAPAVPAFVPRKLTGKQVRISGQVYESDGLTQEWKG